MEVSNQGRRLGLLPLPIGPHLLMQYSLGHLPHKVLLLQYPMLQLSWSYLYCMTKSWKPTGLAKVAVSPAAVCMRVAVSVRVHTQEWTQEASSRMLS